jgi:adenylate cyclase
MVKLTPKEQVALTKRSTLDAEAFDYYLRARGFLYRLSKGNTNIAIQLFQKAIEHDPRYAAAYAGLGEAYAYLYQYWDRRETWLEKAVESSLKAQLYDPTLSEAFAALAVASGLICANQRQQRRENRCCPDVSRYNGGIHPAGEDPTS